MDKQYLGILIFFFVINLVAFLIMLLDKVKSKRAGAERISEGMFFFWQRFLEVLESMPECLPSATKAENGIF